MVQNDNERCCEQERAEQEQIDQGSLMAALQELLNETVDLSQNDP